jgi:hypothetical protein
MYIRCIYNSLRAEHDMPKDKQKKADRKKKAGKKGSQFAIRLEKSERDAFVALCERLDTSAAREIRRFMREFVAAHAASAPAAEARPEETAPDTEAPPPPPKKPRAPRKPRAVAEPAPVAEEPPQPAPARRSRKSATKEPAA